MKFVFVCGSASVGRVHSAVVSGVNVDSRTVTVEWFEKSETKGKLVTIISKQLTILVFIFFESVEKCIKNCYLNSRRSQ
jgi:hypothetical protein